MDNPKLNYSFLYTALAALFVQCLIVANIIAGKLWAAPFGILLTTGVFCFPVVYIIGDVIPEVYGLEKARKVILLGFALNALAVIFFYLCLWAPSPEFWKNQDAFQVVLGFTPRLLLASAVGYLAGTNVNAWAMVDIKKMTGPKWLFVRTIGSTIIGEGIDSVIFVFIAFWGTLNFEMLCSMVVAQAAFKIVYEVLATPLTYAVINWVKRIEGVDQTPA